MTCALRTHNKRSTCLTAALRCFVRIGLAALLSSAIGAAYGFIGAWMNSNPHYEPYYCGQPSTAEAWNWQPSPLWLTSYVLCIWADTGVGIESTKSGYFFPSLKDKHEYFRLSTLWGARLGMFIWVMMVAFKWKAWVRNPALEASGGALCGRN